MGRVKSRLNGDCVRFGRGLHGTRLAIAGSIPVAVDNPVDKYKLLKARTVPCATPGTIAWVYCVHRVALSGL